MWPISVKRLSSYLAVSPTSSPPAPCAADAALRAAERLRDALDALERPSVLDRAVGPVQRLVRALPLGEGRDVLHGRHLGHPLHPAMVQLPVGAWLSAGVLDALPGARRGSGTLIAVGLAGALPAALAGWVDWAEQHEQQMRTGLVHALTNGAAIALYTGSLTARLRGRSGRGRLLAYAGLATVGFGGLLGGHMAYRQAAGANKTEPVPHLVEPGWHAIGRTEEFAVGEPVRRTLGEVPLLVVRVDEATVRVLGDRCSHFSGPLSDGEVADGCVECPWHGSVFRLSDGLNVRGPATAPQPSFETRTRPDGTLEVRLPNAG
ncbi:Rieske (2Fe-2S) protein [Streptomyces sp. ICBB 8177]|uniref:Rieske 2Fe-2S domain-containing protein n=1 Tax=Streptomyces sp. ICBB 8177 TaxID=563922 RepID=UPI000D677259|nr:Rieske (2Fe-2S) protein [Streptomyces sp. ICBB 8177]PWI42928.1 (2Fe-2S)-binding protein [Streptomyces sp. ICBB 8177]